MDDREMIELAAKAAGFKRTRDAKNAMFQVHCWHEGYPNDWEYWNPSTDDDDALRLAVKLGLFLHVSVHAECSYVTDGKLPPKVSVKETHGDDPYAATRRAIVRAAAEIGKAMP